MNHTVTLGDLLRVANHVYGDDLIANRDSGDTLALFIANELSDTFDPDHPIDVACNALDVAITELRTIINALQTLTHAEWSRP